MLSMSALRNMVRQFVIVRMTERLPLILPVRVHRLGAAVHLLEVLEAMLSSYDMLGDEVEQSIVPCTTTHKLLSVQVTTCLPRCNRF